MFQRPRLTRTRLRRVTRDAQARSNPTSQLRLLSLWPQYEPLLTPVFSNVLLHMSSTRHFQ